MMRSRPSIGGPPPLNSSGLPGHHPNRWLRWQSCARKGLTTIATLLDLPVSTVRRWLGIEGRPHATRFDVTDSAWVLSQASLIGRVHSIVVESGHRRITTPVDGRRAF